jgi:hypothetical protein
MQANSATQRVAWSIAEISEATGLSIGFLRNENRRGALKTKKFGRRVLVLDADLRDYLEGSNKEQSTAKKRKSENASQD